MTGSAVRFNQLRFSYGDGGDVIRGINLEVAIGESVAIVGPNGAGKSTLLLHINGLLPDPLPASTDNVVVFDEPVTQSNAANVRQRIGFLFQNPADQLFCNTVLNDVAFGARQRGLNAAESYEVARACLKRVELSEKENRAPQDLSLGEQRRACLAGVLACDPQGLVLDEPTSGLDPRGRRELISLLKSLELTRITATHDLEFVLETCSRVAVMDGGDIHGDGPPCMVLRNEQLMLAHGLEVPLSLRFASN